MSGPAGLQQSIQTKLLRYAKERRFDPNLILTRFAAERLLYRISISPHADRFVLKGAMLLVAWLGDMVRPTRDIDLLGFGDLSDASLSSLFAEVAAIEVAEDGVTFDSTSISVAPIREEDAYGGKRVTLTGRLGTVRLHVQVDIGIGDAVHPEPGWLEYPSLLDLPRPRLRAYRPATSVAEKFHAMVTLGSKNSRMRDFYDIRALSQHEAFDGATLSDAIRATFERRGSVVPVRAPLALTQEFADIEGKRLQWSAFLRKNGLDAQPLDDVLHEVRDFLMPALEGLASRSRFERRWPPGGPWI
jgi:hypothetical protein